MLAINYRGVPHSRIDVGVYYKGGACIVGMPVDKAPKQTRCLV